GDVDVAIVSGGRLRELATLAGLNREQKDAPRLVLRSFVHHSERASVRRPVDDLSSNAGPCVLVSVRQFTLGAAQRGNDVYTFAFARAAQESDVATVGRPGRAHLPRRVGRQAQRLSGPDDLDVDIEVVIFFARPDVSDLLALRREGDAALDERRTRQGRDFECARLRGLIANENLVKANSKANRGDEEYGQYNGDALLVALDLAGQVFGARDLRGDYRCL